MPSPRNDPVSETVMPERLLSETGAAVLTERLGIRVFLGIFAPPKFVAQSKVVHARGIYKVPAYVETQSSIFLLS